MLRPRALLSALATLLLAATVYASAPQTGVNVAVVADHPFDVASRFLETVYVRRPADFFDFVHSLTQYKIRPKTEFANPVFAPKAKGLDGKPRLGPYANHNPIFTRHVHPNESYAALEASLVRSRYIRGRGELPLFRLAYAGGVANPHLEEMYSVWQQREAELAAVGAPKPKKECESWMDVAGRKVCGFDEFWKSVGPEQVIKRGVLRIEGATPETYSFDRFLPAGRNESLPLVILYGAPTSESFPALYDALHALAQPRVGKPRLQFALRFKPDTQSPVNYFLPDFVAEATVKSGLDLRKIEEAADFSSRAIAYIHESKTPKEKLATLANVASSLPSLAADIAGTKPYDKPVAADLDEQLLFNGILLDLSSLSHVDLLHLLESELQLARDVATSAIGFSEENAEEIIVNAKIAFEEPREAAVGLAVPTVEKPLRFVNLAQATRGLSGRFQRGSFLEGVAEDNGEADPPALATFHIVTDLNSVSGRQLAQNALKFAETTGEVRIAFVHNPSALATAPHRFACSTLIAKLVEGGDFAEIYPEELSAFLALNASPDSPPKRSLDDQWTAENPITPFLDGATERDEHVAQAYWTNATTFVERIGLQAGESAVLLNGRLITLDSHELPTPSFSALHQYELKRRIRPVVTAAMPVLPKRAKDDRKVQAEVFAVAGSVISASRIQRKALPVQQVKGLSTFAINDPSGAIFSFTAALDPLSPTARSVLPLLQSFSTFPLTHIRLYLLPTKLDTIDASVSSGRAFPIAPFFEDDRQEAKPSVQLAHGLPAGAILDFKAVLPTGERLAGPGGEGGETVRLESELKEVVFAKVKGAAAVDEAKRASKHLRDEL
ncbi:hypothetical protein JCM10213_003082 [Rhodosporidiobolus nylandii]